MNNKHAGSHDESSLASRFSPKAPVETRSPRLNTSSSSCDCMMDFCLKEENAILANFVAQFLEVSALLWSHDIGLHDVGAM